MLNSSRKWDGAHSHPLFEFLYQVVFPSQTLDLPGAETKGKEWHGAHERSAKAEPAFGLEHLLLVLLLLSFFVVDSCLEASA